MVEGIMALVGVILGWALSEFSKHGKLVFYLREYTIMERTKADNGGDFYESRNTVENKDGIIRMKLQVTNTSGTNKNAIGITFLISKCSYSFQRLDTITIEPYKTNSFDIDIPFKDKTISASDSVFINFLNAKGKPNSFRLRR